MFYCELNIGSCDSLFSFYSNLKKRPNISGIRVVYLESLQ